MNYIKRLNVLAARRGAALAAFGTATVAVVETRQQRRHAARMAAKDAPALLQQPGADGQPEDPEGVDHGQIMGGESEALR